MFLFWEQRARVDWIIIGDRNTSFFHKVASSGKKKEYSERNGGKGRSMG